MGVKKDAILSYESNTMAKLVHAMSIMELGKAYAVSENQVIETIKEFRLF